MFNLFSKYEERDKNLNYRMISMRRVKAMIENEEVFTLLDVRSNDEFKRGNIKTSVSLPINEIEPRISDFANDKYTNIIVYCQTGRRSLDAAYKLLELGYVNVFDMGGIADWPYEVEK